MEYLADFHIHSRYSLATSKEADLKGYSKMAVIKGLNVLGTGDFTHPKQVEDIKKSLTDLNNGLFKLNETIFILSAEVSCIYRKAGRTRKLHLIILMPSIEAVERFNKSIEKLGKLASDGRPVLASKTEDMGKMIMELALAASDQAMVIPAHIWTPWFSLFGSRSGFDSIEECFEDLSTHIRAIETGLSSDPKMNRMVKQFDNINIISNSDAHSPSKLGREATILQIDATSLSYDLIYKALQTGKGLKGTLEFFPEEGKYFYDGHRNCNISLHPGESAKHKNICPVCKKALTLGVLSRVMDLSRKEEKDDNHPYCEYLVPLVQIISEVIGKRENSKIVVSHYNNMINKFGNELNILRRLSTNDIASYNLQIADAILRIRNRNIKLIPGYDGVYGKISVTN